MQFRVLAILASLGAFVSAQSLSDIPSCANACLLAAVQQTGCTPQTDVQCQCAGFAKLETSITSCLANSTCTDADDTKVRQLYNSVCASTTSTSSAASGQATSGTTQQAAKTGGAGVLKAGALTVLGASAVVVGFLG